MAKAIVDTNVIVSFLLDRDRVFVEAVHKYDRFIAPTEVISEAIFVLEGNYGCTKREVVEMISRFVRLDVVESERSLLLQALLFYHEKPFHWIDCLEVCRARMSEVVLLTSDKKLKKYA